MTPEEQAKQALESEIDQILNKDFKQFVDSTRLYFGKSYFALRLNVGPQGFTYTLTPELTKLLSRVFMAQVENYEKHFGAINVDLPALSPVQMSDLQNPPEDSSQQEPPKGGPKPDKPSGPNKKK